MVVGVDDHLGGAVRRLEGGEAVVEDGDLEAREGDLGRRPAGQRGVERAVVAGGQERAFLAVDRVDDLLAAQLGEAQLAHARRRLLVAGVEDQRAAVVFDVARDCEGSGALGRVGLRRRLRSLLRAGAARRGSEPCPEGIDIRLAGLTMVVSGRDA